MVPEIRALKQRMKDDLEYHGIYPRLLFMSLLEHTTQYLNELAARPFEQLTENEKEKFEGLVKFIVNLGSALMEIQSRKSYNIDKTHLQENTDIYRRKLYVWESMCLIRPALNAKLASHCALHMPQLNFEAFIHSLTKQLWSTL